MKVKILNHSVTIKATKLLNTDSWEIIQTKDNYWRYVNHNLKRATTGFLYLPALMKYKNDFLDTETVREKQLERYKKFFSERIG